LNHVLKAFSAVKKRGKELHFQSLVFDKYLWEPHHTGSLSSIEPNKSFHASLTPRMQQVYLIGKSDGKTLLPSFSKQIRNSTLPLLVDKNNAHQIALKTFARTLVKEEMSGTSNGEQVNANTNQNSSNGTGSSVIPSTPTGTATAAKIKNADPASGNTAGVTSNMVTPHPPSQLSSVK
jgi:hypothetical protein